MPYQNLTPMKRIIIIVALAFWACEQKPLSDLSLEGETYNYTYGGVKKSYHTTVSITLASSGCNLSPMP